MVEEKVLTQADIDAMVAQVPSKPAAPKPVVPVVSVPNPAPKPVEPEKPAVVLPPLPPREGTTKFERYTSSEVSNLQSVIADMAREVSKMTNAMQRLEQVEGKINQISALLKITPGSTETLGERVDEISGGLDQLRQQYLDIRGEFQCGHCQSRQMVALHVKCTSCGEETWMGWWPDGNQK